MKKTSRKVLSILLCLLLLLPMASAVVPVAGAEGDEAVVTEGGEVTVAGVLNSMVYVKFVPESGGRFVGYIANGVSANVNLYDRNYNWFSADFSGNGVCLSYYMSAGETYYFGIECLQASEDVTLAVKTPADYAANVLTPSATALSPGEPQSLTLAPGEVQVYRFTPDVSDYYMLYLTGGEGVANISCYDKDLYGRYTANHASNTFNLEQTEQGSTSYFFIRNLGSTTIYQQLIVDTCQQYVANEIAPQATSLTSGEAAVPLTYDGAYYFSFIPDQTARYTFWSENANDVTLNLYKTSMAVLGTAYNSEPLRTSSKLQAGTTYYLKVYAYSDAPNAVLHAMKSTDYAATYIAADAVELPVGTSNDVTIDNTTRYYKLVAPATGNYTVAVNNSQSNSVSVSMYDDEMVSINGTSGKNVLFETSVEAGKTYYLSLYGWYSDSIDATVTVKKTVDYLADQATEILQDVAVPGTLAYDARAVYKFVPATTQNYVISTGAANALEGRVFDVDADSYRGTTFGNADYVDRIQMTAGKTYYLIVRNYHPEMDYSIKVQSAADYYMEMATPLTLNEQTEITSGSSNTFIRFTPDQDGAYIFLLDRASWMNAYLYTDAFKELSYVYGSDRVALTGTLTAGKTYFVSLSTNGYGEPFQATVMKLADYLSAEAQVLTLDTEVAIDSNGDHFFRFIPAETGNYTLVSQGEANPQTILLNADMSELARNDDISAFDSNFKLEYSLTAGETYYYRVSSYNDGYTIRLSRTCDHTDTVEVSAVAMTCTVDGYTAGVYCNVCGEWLSGHVKTRATHKDADKDRVCEICGQPAILKTYSCNEADTVTATFYLNGDLVVAGTGAMETVPWLQDETEDEFFLYTLLYTVTNIEIAEGVTAVCPNAFTMMEKVRTVSLPASVTEVGQGAFSQSYITDLTILNDTLPISNQFSLPGYVVHSGTFPFTTYDSYYKYRMTLMSAEYLGYAGGIYGDYLDELIEMEVQALIEEGMTEEAANAYMDQMLEEALGELVLQLNIQIGTNAATMEELRDQLLAKVNAALGTAYTAYTDVVTVTMEPDDDGYFDPQIAWTDDFLADVEAVFGVSIDGLSQVDYSVNLFTLGKTSGSYTPFQDVTIHANCGSTAQTAATASRVKFDSLKHDYAETELTPATCTADGVMQYQCKFCDDSYTAPIAKKGHSFTHYVADGNAACEADGTKTAACDNGCGATDTVADPGSKLGHDYKATITTPATCGKDGVRTYTCTHNPAHTYTEKINATGNHTWGDWVTTKQPTEKETGVKTRTCSVCGQSQNDTIPKLNPQPQPNPNVCHWCGKVHSNDFFQKIVAFFHNIFAKVFGNRH